MAAVGTCALGMLLHSAQPQMTTRKAPKIKPNEICIHYPLFKILNSQGYMNNCKMYTEL